MKKSKQHANAIKRYFRPEIGICPFCHKKLKYDHIYSRKYVTTFHEETHVHNMGYRCIDDDCHNQHNRRYYHSAQADALTIKGYTYGLDVITYIGFERTKYHRNIKEIHTDLLARNIDISERNVEYLYNAYLILMKCSLPERLSQIRPLIDKNGGIILSIDGLQPEKGNDMLYVIRDTLTEEVLHVECIPCSDTNSMVSLLQEIVKKDIPVLGIVSDAQRSIRKAVEIVFPDVPYQLCQFHYLKDIAKPVTDADRALKTDIKKELRGLRKIEQNLQKRTDPDSEILLGYT